jgi:hypothetical protein
MAIADLVLMMYLAFNKKYLLSLFVLFIIIFANARSEPLTSKETDYQSAVYMVFSLFAVVYMLFQLYERLKERLLLERKVIYSVFFLILSVYALFDGLYLWRVFSEKAYGRYMGTAPRIYDRPQIAPMLNAVVAPGETTWIGPFEFEELFYTKAPIASKYQIFNPGEGHSPKIQNELISDFEKNKPKIIWFDKRFSILGQRPEQYGQDFIQYLTDHYETVMQHAESGGVKYVPNYPFEQRVDIETKLYIRKDNFDEIISRLLEKGYIRISE